MERGRESGDQIELAAEIGQRLQRLNKPDLPFDPEKIEKLIANLMVPNVDAKSSVTQLLRDEQKETGATT